MNGISTGQNQSNWRSDLSTYFAPRRPSFAQLSRTDPFYQSILEVLSISETARNEKSCSTDLVIEELLLTRYNSRNFRITTSGEKYFLKMFSGWRYTENREYAQQLSDLHHYLRDLGAPVSTPMGGIGHGIIEKANSQWQLSRWREHSWYNASPSEAAALGSGLAKTHSALKNFSISDPGSAIVTRGSDLGSVGSYLYVPTFQGVLGRIDDALNSKYDEREQNLRKILDAEKARILTVAKVVEETLDENFFKPDCTHLIHGDLLAHNIIVTNEELLIVDFEKVLRSNPLYDLGTAWSTTALICEYRNLEPSAPSTGALIDAYNQESATQHDAAIIKAFGLLSALHLALVNVENIFIRRNFRGAMTSERLFQKPGQLLSC